MSNVSQIAAIQMVSGKDVEENLSIASELCKQAAANGAHLLVLPENFALLDSSEIVPLGQREAETGFLQNTLSELSRSLGVWIVGGSIPVAAHETSEKVKSTSIVYDDKGEERGRYEKLHLFDVDVGDETGAYRESDRFEPGTVSTVVDTPLGKMGMAICYDLRFSELFLDMRYQGADFFILPSAFTHRTGEAHWELLLRARAVECQCYMVGVNQGGWHSKSRRTWGHSMIVDPWGRVLASQEEGEAIVSAGIDHGLLSEIRANMPIQAHRRFKWPEIG